MGSRRLPLGRVPVGWAWWSRSDHARIDANARHALPRQRAAHNPAGGSTAYFGASGAAPSASAGSARVYVLDDGTITGASVYSYASIVAGTGEDWVLAIRLNDTTDTTIATVASTAAGRVF